MGRYGWAKGDQEPRSWGSTMALAEEAGRVDQPRCDLATLCSDQTRLPSASVASRRCPAPLPVVPRRVVSVSRAGLVRLRRCKRAMERAEASAYTLCGPLMPAGAETARVFFQ